MDQGQTALPGTSDEPVGAVPRNLELVEREKYEKIWNDPRYRRYSPGEGLVHEAYTGLGMQERQSLIDYGCGTGRALKHFASWGLDVLGIDIAENCLEVDVAFMRACLWDLPDVKSTHAYCTDVMEHIPEDRVDDVLAGIAKRSIGAYFQIALRPDSSGPMIIGEQLHLTVKGDDWWRHKLRKYWDEVSMKVLSTNVRAICRGVR